MSLADPFALLGLPRSFDLDGAALQRAWLQASARMHPDRIADPLERAEAAGRIAQLNEARAILVDEERRARALLALLGGADDDGGNELPDGFLMEILSIREEMETAAASGDPAERARFEAWARDERAQHVERARALFADAGGAPTAEQRRTIRVELNAWRYIERLIEQLDPDHEPIM